VEQDTAAEVLAAPLCQPAQAAAIGGRHGSGRFDIHAPGLATTSDHQVNFHLIFVTVVPEAQVGVGPSGLGDQSGLHTQLVEVALFAVEFAVAPSWHSNAPLGWSAALLLPARHDRQAHHGGHWFLNWRDTWCRIGV